MNYIKLLTDQRRATRSSFERVFLSVVIAELERKAGGIGLDGVKLVSNDVAIGTFKKLREASLENLALMTDRLAALSLTDPARGPLRANATNYNSEIALLDKLIPSQMTAPDIAAFITNDPAITDLKTAMAALKAQKTGLYDGKVASQVARSMFA